MYKWPARVILHKAFCQTCPPFNLLQKLITLNTRLLRGQHLVSVERVFDEFQERNRQQAQGEALNCNERIINVTNEIKETVYYFPTSKLNDFIKFKPLCEILHDRFCVSNSLQLILMHQRYISMIQTSDMFNIPN